MLIENPNQLEAIQKEVLESSVLAIDTETNFTNKYHERYCLGISFATDRNHYYIPVGHKEWAGVSYNNIPTQPLQNFFSRYNGPVIFHNAIFDIIVLEKLGIEIPKGRVWDTMLMSHYIDENHPTKETPHAWGHKLEALSARYLPDRKLTGLAKAMKDNWERIPPYVMAKYAEQDAFLTRDLYQVLLPLMKKDWLDQWTNIDREFAYLLIDMTKQGLKIDRDLCQSLENQCDRRLWEIRQKLGFDPAKPSQLHPKLFYDPPLGLGLIPSSYTSTGKPQVSSAYLESVGHPTTALCLEYRKISKQKSSYFSAYLGLTSRDYARLHPSFKMHGTVTRRLSSEEPNPQQLPRQEYKGSRVKDVFLPEEEKQLWEIDFRTLEYRMTAVYSQDPRLIQLFNDEGDIHQLTADDAGVGRFSGKQLNYIIIMGGGIKAVSKELKCSPEEAKRMLNKYWEANPKIKSKIWEATEHVNNNRGEINLWNGTTRHFLTSYEYSKAFNSVIQGGAFEIVKRSMLELRKAGYTMSNQVHDAVWLPEIEKEDDVIYAQKLMEDWTPDMFGLRFSTDRKLLKK